MRPCGFRKSYQCVLPTEPCDRVAARFGDGTSAKRDCVGQSLLTARISVAHRKTFVNDCEENFYFLLENAYSLSWAVNSERKCDSGMEGGACLGNLRFALRVMHAGEMIGIAEKRAGE